jgi:hypothetical protein
MLDIYSRSVVHGLVAPTETAEPAERFIADAIAAHGGIAPTAVRADPGTSVTSPPVAALPADLTITQSHSRPHVSADTPFSEAQFRTLRYRPVFPERFASIQHARAFLPRDRRVPTSSALSQSRVRLGGTPMQALFEHITHTGSGTESCEFSHTGSTAFGVKVSATNGSALDLPSAPRGKWSSDHSTRHAWIVICEAVRPACQGSPAGSFAPSALRRHLSQEVREVSSEVLDRRPLT